MAVADCRPVSGLCWSSSRALQVGLSRTQCRWLYSRAAFSSWDQAPEDPDRLRACGSPHPGLPDSRGLVESFYPQATGARALPANRGDKGGL